MPKFYYGKGMQLVARTLPCVAMTAAANAAFGVVALLFYGAIGGMLYLLPESMGLLKFILVCVALGGNFALFKLFKRYFLYMIRAGHVAVMAELLAHGKLPEGANQMSWGKQQVTKRLGTVSIAFLIDDLVRGVVAAITKLVDGFTGLLHLEALKQAGQIIMAVIRTATSYIDEAIMARVFIERDKNPFESAKEGTILYAQAWKPILTNAAGLALFSWASMAIFIVMALPVGYVLAKMMPGAFFIPTIAVLLIAHLAKVSLGDTFALATTMAAFHEETKAMTPSREWDAKLSSVSDKFRELKNKAMEKMSPEPQTTTVVSVPPVPDNVVAFPAPSIPAASGVTLPPLPQQPTQHS